MPLSVIPVVRCKLSVLSFLSGSSFASPASVMCVFCNCSQSRFAERQQMVDAGIGDSGAPNDELLQIWAPRQQFRSLIRRRPILQIDGR